MRHVLLGKSLLFAGVFLTSVSSMAQVTQKWVQRENGDPNTPDQASALVVDNKNDVIVTGQSQGKGTNYDFATIKYDDDGSTKWVKRYNGSGNGDDEPTGIAADSNCNVFVTGNSRNGINNDIATIKYDPDGNTKWVKRFTGASADAIAVDRYGNAYVTGTGTAASGGIGITTIKYDGNGNIIWVRRFGSGSASAIVVDKNGNVYVTGAAPHMGTGGDATTIKYDNDGNLLWVSQFNGSPINDADVPSDLAVDNNGNVYITGFSITELAADDHSEIFTVKYNASGVQQWSALFSRNTRDEGKAIGVDASGNVFITGFSGTAEEDPDNDYVTIKYNSAGVQQWVQVVVSPAVQQGGGANDLVLDAAGNVYITGGLLFSNGGTDYTTIKYNTNGVQQWIAVYDGPGSDYDIANAIGIDKNGNIYITGFSRINGFSDDYATIKYSNNGVQKWVNIYNGPSFEKGNPDFVTALAVDKDGNAHVTGAILRNKTGYDYATFKYDTNGGTDWKKTYNGTGKGPDFANALALDAQGNVYVTGRSKSVGNQASGDDYATVKYDAAGNSQWGKRYNGPADTADASTAIAVDVNGNVYVTGQSIGTNGSYDFATIKYDAAGNTKWVKRYDGPGHGFDGATKIAVDAAGNVYVTGISIGSGTLEDYVTIKYDPNGNLLWVARYNGPDNTNDEAHALAIDASGNVYVTGGSFGSGTLSDYATIKYNAAGVQQWVARYHVNNDVARDIAVDAAGNVYVTGFSGNNGNLDDYATVKYNAAGVQQWAARYDAAGSGDEANALALDAAGNVYVTGGSRLSNNSFPDYATVKYNAIGIQQWVARYNGPGNGSDVAVDIGLDAAGNVYVTGTSEGNLTQSDYATIKYEQTPLVTMSTVADPVPNNLAIEQRESAKLSVKAFPNAFTSYINLQWSGSDKPVTITITDDMGRLVEKRTGLAASGALQTGSKFGKGVYFAEIVQGGEKIVLKLVKN
ncbi:MULTISPECIES: SBBP repeat-containing protein [Niastella]|uniref:SBBP repeat-containing protein n=1 Tax=Niastella soli TaxID=2821487 RepID=A0ABS3YUX1_9BACT|nr:SBBP repeat-containing protein [Niastella soli]MBO9201624.1 SBBP repeat-containing protein [Niastella soli]